MITCKPWNPVAIKNVDPYTASEILNLASQYSSAWSEVKYTPKIKVITKLKHAWVWLLSMIEWCVQVTVTPDDKRIIVFNSGIWNGLKGETPKGGHIIPISKVGDRLLLKNPQKKERKKNTSDTINSTIPHFIPVNTLIVCSPWKVLSREISRHHWYDVIIKITSPTIINSIDRVWNHLTIPVVRVNAPILAINGQGLWSTKWKAWFFLIIISD